MSESLRSTSETNIMLYINHTLLKKIIICMKLEGKEYQPITPTGQRHKLWRVDLEGQWRQDHGASSLCEALPGFFRLVGLNTGISNFFFFFFQCKHGSRAFWLYLHSVRQTGVSSVPCLYKPGVLPVQFSWEEDGNFCQGRPTGHSPGGTFRAGWRWAGAGEIAESGLMAWADDALWGSGCIGVSEITRLLLLPQLSPGNISPFM